MDGALKLHISLDLSIDRQIGQAQNFLLVLRILIPAVQELMRFLDLKRVSQETLHPLDMVVLTFKFELVSD